MVLHDGIAHVHILHRVSILVGGLHAREGLRESFERVALDTMFIGHGISFNRLHNMVFLLML